MNPTYQTIGYLGPEGSHSQQAAETLLEQWFTPHPNPLPLGERGLNVAPWPTIARLMAGVAEGQAAYGLLPIENALEGPVVEVMEALGLNKYPLRVLAETTQPVLHCLIRPKNARDVTTVVSHPQALAQCRESLIRRYGDDMRQEMASSTSEAVKRLRDEDHPDWAAIGTQAAAERYGLVIEESDISDAPDNRTRFMLVTAHANKAPELPANWAKKPKKTSVCMGLKDRPGVLADVLVILKEHGVNLTRIESRPSKKRFGDYLFYLDMDCDLTDSAQQPALQALRQETAYLNIMGPYTVLG